MNFHSAQTHFYSILCACMQKRYLYCQFFRCSYFDHCHMPYVKDAYKNHIMSAMIIPSFCMQKVDVLSRLNAVEHRNRCKKMLVVREFLISDTHSLLDNQITWKKRGFGVLGYYCGCTQGKMHSWERTTRRSRRSSSRRHGWRSCRSTLIIRVSGCCSYL